MKNAHVIDEARLGIMLNELRLPTIKTLWPRLPSRRTGKDAMTLAAVDRLVHHATIFEMNSAAGRYSPSGLAMCYLPTPDEPGVSSISGNSNAVPAVSVGRRGGPMDRSQPRCSMGFYVDLGDRSPNRLSRAVFSARLPSTPSFPL
jgi:hypothetical protein